MEEKSTETISVSVRQFVTARTQELIAISSRLAKPGRENSHTPFKHIPKNLRRRAVSHNVKRMPFRFRPKASDTPSGNQSGKGSAISFVSPYKQKKSGSRKHQRRKSNLLLEFNRRQRTYKWIETHIWHAKRFHIEPKWNYKIPIAPCDKGRRALYRATKSYVTMQDISFTSLYQLDGDFQEICSTFSSVAPSQCNLLSVGAVMFKSGDRQGKLHIFRKGSYPFGYIGDVNFQWLKRRSEEKSSLWLWIHPAIKEDILNELLLVFNLSVVPQYPKKSSASTNDLSEKMGIDEIKLLPKTTGVRYKYCNEENTMVLSDLEGEVSRLRFTGPESLSVLKEVLLPTNQELAKLILDNPKCISVLNEYIGNEKLIQSQQLLWSLLESLQDFPAHTILPLIVRDPRVFLPQSRAKILLNDDVSSEAEEESDNQQGNNGNENESMEIVEEVQNGNSIIPDISELLTKFNTKVINSLEDPGIRMNLVKHKMSDYDFCQRRAGLLIPGSQIELGSEENQVPVMLVHRPATSNAGNYSDGGFDLVLPAGWAMAFWIALAYRAVRVTALRDSISCAFETGNIFSTYFLAPDSSAGEAEKSYNEEFSRKKYFNLSPAKRPNLIKLSCCSPFTQDWEGLLGFWKSQDDNSEAQSQSFYILRDQKKLALLAANVKSKFWTKLVENLESINELHKCLVGIRVELLGRGKPDDTAIICMPTTSDVEDSSTRQVSDLAIHTEPIHKDSAEHKERVDFRQKHQKVMAFFRKKRKKLHRANKICDNEDLKAKNSALLQCYNSQALSQVYNDRMNQSWLIRKDKSQQTYQHLSRKPMGFLICGGNEYSQGKCSGLGFVSAAALLQFAKNAMENKKLGKCVLIRNWTDSLIYRTAKFKILNI